MFETVPPPPAQGLLTISFRYISMKRGSMIVVIVSIACNPWRFLNQAVIFIEIFSGFAIFATATVAILNADYWIIRRRKWKVPDLFHEGGIYWFSNGINWRAIATWVIAVIPAFPGFARNMHDASYNTGVDYRMYQMSFFVGYPVAVVTYIIINKIWPVEGLGIQESLPEPSEDGVIEGESPSEHDLSSSEKDIAVVETKPVKTLQDTSV